MQIPPLVQELSPQQFQQWRHHPVTHMLLQEYLPQWVEARKQQVIDAWLNGNQDLPSQNVVRGQIMAYLAISTMTLADIRHFYGLPPVAEK